MKKIHVRRVLSSAGGWRMSFLGKKKSSSLKPWFRSGSELDWIQKQSVSGPD
jgi:hypothetical protein